MTETELIKHIADVHNRLADIAVKGDGAILMGDALKELRFIVHDIQQSGVGDEEDIDTDKGEV